MRRQLDASSRLAQWAGSGCDPIRQRKYASCTISQCRACEVAFQRSHHLLFISEVYEYGDTQSSKC